MTSEAGVRAGPRFTLQIKSAARDGSCRIRDVSTVEVEARRLSLYMLMVQTSAREAKTFISAVIELLATADVIRRPFSPARA